MPAGLFFVRRLGAELGGCGESGRVGEIHTKVGKIPMDKGGKGLSRKVRMGGRIENKGDGIWVLVSDFRARFNSWRMVQGTPNPAKKYEIASSAASVSASRPAPRTPLQPY